MSTTLVRIQEKMSRSLRLLAVVMGAACVAIGVLHFLGGIHSVPGEGSAGPTVDSRERFYGAIFLGYGLAWWWAGRQRPLPIREIRVLSSIFLLGGIGRLLSLVAEGSPQPFQSALTAVELVIPIVAFALAGGTVRSEDMSA